jgi:predicted ArsR family transcriptional regulator
LSTTGCGVVRDAAGCGWEYTGFGNRREIGDHKLASRERDVSAGTCRDLPSPEALLAFLRGVSHAVNLAAIAANFGVKPKQVAAQVDALCERGLVVKYPPRPSRSGRGKQRYAAAMADADTPETQDAYLGLSDLLLGVLVGGRDPDEVGKMAGRLIGQAVVSNDSSAPDDAVAQLESFLESRGFAPEQIGSRPDIGFVLGTCPFERAALINPSLVCGLHRALAEGMAEALGGAFQVTDLVARDPRKAGCRLELRIVRQPD